MRRPITSTTRRDGFPISEWYVPLLLSSLISLSPCILVLVVHNAAVAGATDRLLLGPCSSLETARKHESSRPPFGVARTVAGPLLFYGASPYPQGRAHTKRKEKPSSECHPTRRGSRRDRRFQENPRRLPSA